MRDHFHQFDILTSAEIWCDTLQNFDIRSEILSFCSSQAILDPVSRSRGSTEASVTRDPNQNSTSRESVTRDCRIEGKNPVTMLQAFSANPQNLR
jgi:hypothetical protein